MSGIHPSSRFPSYFRIFHKYENGRSKYRNTDRTRHDFSCTFSSLVTSHHYLTVSWQLWRCSRACQTGPGERWPGAAGGHKGDDGGAGQDDGRQRQRSEEKNCLYHPISRDLSKRYLSRASSERASSSRASDHSAVHVAPIGHGAARRAVYSPPAQIFFFLSEGLKGEAIGGHSCNL